MDALRTGRNLAGEFAAAGRSWVELDDDGTAIEQDVQTARVVDCGTLVGMFERFTDRARRVLVLAQEEARLLNHDFIGTEHLLLGLIHEGDGVAAKALAAAGITLADARRRVEERLGPLHSQDSHPPQFTERAKKTLESALREALELGHNYVGTEHQLLGLISVSDGAGAHILVGLGADLAVVRQQVLDMLSGVPPDALRAAGSTDFVAVTPGMPAPYCGNCRAPLAEWARYVTLAVAPAASEPGGDPLPVTVVYCSRCGRAIERR